MIVVRCTEQMLFLLFLPVNVKVVDQSLFLRMRVTGTLSVSGVSLHVTQMFADVIRSSANKQKEHLLIKKIQLFSASVFCATVKKFSAEKVQRRRIEADSG